MKVSMPSAAARGPKRGAHTARKASGTTSRSAQGESDTSRAATVNSAPSGSGASSSVTPCARGCGSRTANVT